jgi:DNA polymerase-3 subunit gamma/tau
MLAKDSKTVALMEVGETIKEAYQKDTEGLSTQYLLDAIALINNCELHFRNVKNRRVHVELALMQLASLHFNGEKKKGYIIPASEYNSKSKAQTNNPTPLTTEKYEKSVQKTEVEPPIVEEKEPSYKEVSTAHNTTTEDTSKPIAPKKTEYKAAAPVSSFSLSSIALKKAANKVTQEKVLEKEKPKDAFTLGNLKILWQDYIDTLKKKGKLNIASILSMNNIELEDTDQIVFTVANEMNKVEVNQEMEFLLPFLRKRLNNFEIKLKLIVTETVKEETVFSPTEKYQYLVKLNPTLEELRNKFDLDF